METKKVISYEYETKKCAAKFWMHKPASDQTVRGTYLDCHKLAQPIQGDVF